MSRIMIVTAPLLLVAALVSCSRQAEDDDAPAPVRPAKIIEIQAAERRRESFEDRQTGGEQRALPAGPMTDPG